MQRCFPLLLSVLAACAQGTFHPEEPAALIVESSPPGSASGSRTEAEPAPVPVRKPAPAPAPTRDASPEDRAAARKLFQEAVRAFDQGNYLDARQLFAQAYERAPMPQVLYNLAMADLKDGDLQAACEHFRQWKAAPQTDPARVVQAQPVFAACQP